MSHRTQFREEIAAPDDPTDQRSCPFDWEELEQAMGESELGPVEYERLAFAFGQVMRWLVGEASGREDLSQVGTRVLILCQRISPETLAQHRGRQRFLRIVRRVTRSK